MQSAILKVIKNYQRLPEIANNCRIPHPLDQYVIELDRLYHQALDK